MKHWLRILQLEKEELLRRWFEWQIVKFKIWNLGKRIESIHRENRIGIYLAQPQESSVSRTCKKFNEQCNDVEQHNCLKIEDRRSHEYFIVVKTGMG